MSHREQPPPWQPIEMLASIVRIVATQSGHTQTQLRLLDQVRGEPHLLDGAVVARARRVFTAQRDDLWLFEEQQRRWAAERQLTAGQRGQVEELGRATRRLRQQTEQALALVNALAAHAIARVLTTPDLEPGPATLPPYESPN